MSEFERLEAVAECARLRTKNDELKAALKPFALDYSRDLSGDQEQLLRSPTWGRHCRKAFAVLTGR